MLFTIDTILSVAGIGHSYISGVKQSKEFEKIIGNLESLNSKIEKISDNILYNKSLIAVEDINRNKQKVVSDLRNARLLLEPIQKIYDNKIISSSIITTPNLMKESFSNNPWKVLDNIKPANYAEKHDNPDMVPIFFDDGGKKYVGWQMKGIMPTLLGCKYNSEFENNKVLITDYTENRKWWESLDKEWKNIFRRSYNIINIKPSDMELIEIMSSTEVNCSYSKIKNLNPLKNLKNLNYLDCSVTSIKSLYPVINLKLNKIICHTTEVSLINIKKFSEANEQCEIIIRPVELKSHQKPKSKSKSSQKIDNDENLTVK